MGANRQLLAHIREIRKDEHSALPPMTASSVPGGIFAAEDVGLRTALTQEGKKDIGNLSNLSKITTPTEPVYLGRLDGAKHRLPLNPHTLVAHPESRLKLEVLASATSELLKTPKDVGEEVLTTPQPWPASPLTSTHQAQATPNPRSTHPVQVPTPNPAPTKTEPEQPLSLWEHKKPKAMTQPALASSSFGGGDATNSLSLGFGERLVVVEGTPSRSLCPPSSEIISPPLLIRLVTRRGRTSGKISWKGSWVRTRLGGGTARLSRR